MKPKSKPPYLQSQKPICAAKIFYLFLPPSYLRSPHYPPGFLLTSSFSSQTHTHAHMHIYAGGSDRINCRVETSLACAACAASPRAREFEVALGAASLMSSLSPGIIYTPMLLRPRAKSGER